MALSHMFKLAIFKTLLQKQFLAAFDLQQSLTHRRAIQSIYFKTEDINTKVLREPTNDEKIHRLAKLIKHYTKNIRMNAALKILPRASSQIILCETQDSPSETKETPGGKSTPLRLSSILKRSLSQLREVSQQNQKRNSRTFTNETLTVPNAQTGSLSSVSQTHRSITSLSSRQLGK